VISARGVRIEVAGRPLLDGMNFDILPGEFVAVLGSNGVGKTTLLRAMNGRHGPSAGTLALDGRAIADLDGTTRARSMAFMTSDDAPIDNLTAREVVATGRYPFHRWWQWNATREDEAAIDGALQAVGMRELGERAFETLSSGERQRIWLALGLAQEAPYLLLDEPTSHLDVRFSHEILGLLREQARAGKAIVCAIHDINDAAAFADRMLLLGDRRIVAWDTPERVLTADNLHLAYGIPMETVRTSTGSIRVFA